MPKQQWEEKTRHPPTESSISVPKIPPRTCAFLRHRKWGGDGGRGRGRGERHAEVGEQTTTISGFARTRIAVVSIACLPLLLISPLLSFVFVLRLVLFLLLLLPFFFFSFVRCPLESIPLDSFLTLAMGRPIATSADSALLRIPTYLFPIYLIVRGQGEPDLSPLNGINKLYYACTSP